MGARDDLFGSNNYFDDLIQRRKEQAQVNVYEGINADPARHAEALKLSDRVGLPADVVARNLDEVKKQDALRSFDVDRLEKENPALYEFLQNDKDFVKVAHRDIRNLSGIERAMQASGDVARAVPGGFLQGAGLALRGAADLNDAAAAYIAAGLEQVLPQEAMDVLRSPVTWYLSPSGIVRRPGQQIGELAESVMPPEERQNIATDIAAGVGQITQQILAGIVTGPAAGTAALFAQGAGQQGDRADEAGADEMQRAGAVLTGAAITGLTERTGLDLLLNRVPPAVKNRALRQLTDISLAGGIEAAQEAAEGVLQNLTAYAYYDPDAKIFEGIEREAIAAGGAGAIFRGVVNAVTRGRTIQSEGQKNEQSIQDVRKIENVVKLAKQTEIAKLAPGKFEAMVKKAAELAGISDVYIPIDQARTFLQTDGVDTDKLLVEFPDIQTRIAEAETTGGDIQIPYEKFVSFLGRNDGYDELLKMVKLDPELRSALEVDEANAALAEALQQDFQASEQAATAERSGYQEVFDAFYTQAVNAGYTPDVARQHAAIFARRQESRAQQLGMDVREIAREEGLTIRREMPGELRQTETLGFLFDENERQQLRATVGEQAAEYVDPAIVLKREMAARTFADPSDPEAMERVLGRRPESLFDVIKKLGGVSTGLTAEERANIQSAGGRVADYDGDIARVFDGNKGLRAQLVRQNGLGLDDILTALKERGFVGDEATTDDLIALMEQEAGGQRVFDRATMDEVSVAQMEDDLFERTLAELGVSPDSTVEEIATAMAVTYGEQQAGGVEFDGQTEFDQEVRGTTPYSEPTIEVDGKVRPTTNSKGMPIAATKEGLENFWRWFGDSKVVDADGRPVVVYHGTASGFDAFLPGSFFTVSRDLAEGYGQGDGQRIVEAYLSIQNPATGADVIRVAQVLPGWFDDLQDEYPGIIFNQVPGVQAALEAEGFDGAEFFDGPGGDSDAPDAQTFVAFSTTQIKSVNNRGTFDPSDPVIFNQGVDEYGMTHRPPSPEDGAPAHDVTGGGDFYPADVYSDKGLQYYGTGDRKADAESLAVIKKVRGKPDAEVTIYRAVPKGLGVEINSGDWVTLSKTYAEQHGDANVSAGYEILSKKVKAKELFTNADSLNEFGYWKDGRSFDQPSQRGETVEQFEDRLRKELGLTNLSLSGHNGRLKLNMISVARDEQGQGKGSKAMKAITDYADSNGLRIELTTGMPDDGLGTTSQKRLIQFYKRFGFVENKGRNKDFSVSGNMYREARQSLTLSQPSQRGAEGRARGNILIQNEGMRANYVITLFKESNLSTLLHEMGHMFVDQLTRDAQRQNSPEDIKADLEVLMKFTGVETVEKFRVNVEAQEKLARGFEAYLMKGKAPSLELQGAFQRFKAWFMRIYKTVASLDVEINDEVRAVFDRMLATDEQIEAMRQSQQFQASGDIVAMMNEQERTAYNRAVEKSLEKAKEDLLAKSLKDVTRENEKWWQDELAAVREQVASEIDSMPVYRAFSALTTGKLPDGTEMPVKLNRNALVEAYGEQALTKLPRGFQRVYSAERGVHPDIAADMFGYRSGDEMVKALLNMEPRKQAIELRAQAIMEERHGNMMTDGTLEREAIAAMTNQERQTALESELSALQRRAGQPVTASRVIRAAAERIMGGKSVGEATKYSKYVQYQVKAAREAEKALAAGDMENAVLWKRRQLLNHHMYLVAREADEKVSKDLQYVAGFRKNSRRDKVDPGYLEQIDELLTRYDFRKSVTLRKIRSRRSLQDWYAEQKELGYEPAIPEEVLNDSTRRSYKEMTLEEFAGVVDSIRSIHNLGKMKREFMLNGERRRFEEVRDNLISVIESNTDKIKVLRNQNPDFIDRGKMFTASWDASLLKTEMMIRWLDGGAVGDVWQAMFKPFVQAQFDENRILRDVADKVRTALVDVPKQTRARWNRKVTFDGVVNEDGTPRTFRVSDILVMAMNLGNDGNRAKLMAGYGWTEQQVEQMTGILTKEDWDTVQRVLDMLEELKPHIQEAHKLQTGVEMKEVAARPIQTKFGTYRGGYFPIVYDTNRSADADQRQTKNMLFEENFFKPEVSRGFTNKRTNYVAPVKLDLDVIPQHVSGVAHYVTHWQAVQQASRLLSDKTIEKAISDKLGREYHQVMKRWLKSIANNRVAANPETNLGHVLRHLRIGFSITAMGFNAATGAVQTLGLATSADEIGYKNVAKGVRQLLTKPSESWDFAMQNSQELIDRVRVMDRDIKAGIEDALGQSGFRAKVQRAAFLHIGYVQLASVDIPTWLGAYQKGLEDFDGNEAKARDYADSALRLTQGSGALKDLVDFQRGGEVQQNFSMFYTFYSTLYARLRAAGHSVKEMGDVPAFVARWATLVSLPVVLESFMRGNWPDEDDESWAEWFLLQNMLFGVATVPFVRDIVSGVAGEYGYSMTPVASMLETATRSAKDLEDGEVSDYSQKKLVETIGVLTHTPTKEVYEFADYLIRSAQGDADFSVQQLLFGEKRD